MIVPVVVPDPGATTLSDAVKVTDWPAQAGLMELPKATLISALVTVSSPFTKLKV